MTIQPVGLASNFHLAERRISRNHTLDELDAKLGQRTVVFTPTGEAVADVVAAAGREIRGLASVSAVNRVLSHNPDALWGLASRERYNVAEPRAEGLVAYLMLNAKGLRALGDGNLNRSDPDLALVARQNERPAGIYCWAIYAPAFLMGAVPLAYEKICIPRYAGISIYAWAATADGHRICQTLGFTRGAPLKGDFAPQLYYYPRGEERKEMNPTYDRYQPTSNERRVTVSVARSFDDLMRIVSLRSAVYIAEQECPYEEEFDGNDLAATHLIGYVGNEPAGCLRLRFFGSFAKVERLAVRHEFRNTRLSFKLVRAGIDLCREKGYRRLYGHSRADLVKFWSMFGFRPVPDRPQFAFSDVAYVEMALDLELASGALAIGENPYHLLRPEGRWHEKGILENSASRGVRTNSGE